MIQHTGEVRLPFYRKHGKVQTLFTDQEFKSRMTEGHFVKPLHKAFCILLYYTGVRKSEALRVVKEQFQVRNNFLLFDVRPRLKSGVQTPPLNIPINAPFVNLLLEAIQEKKEGEKIFPFCSKTAYNIVDRVFYYPQHFRLNRITNFFLDGFTIPQVRSWTGHKTLKGLEAYIGLVSVKKMGESLAKAKSEK